MKGNQPTLFDAVQGVFADACAGEFAGVTCTMHDAVEDGHGRHEERYVTVIENPTGLPAGWPDVAAVVQVNREREVAGVNTTSTHYYLTSRQTTATEMAGLIRGHWGDRERVALAA